MAFTTVLRDIADDVGDTQGTRQDAEDGFIETADLLDVLNVAISPPVPGSTIQPATAVFQIPNFYILTSAVPIIGPYTDNDLILFNAPSDVTITTGWLVNLDSRGSVRLSKRGGVDVGPMDVKADQPILMRYSSANSEFIIVNWGSPERLDWNPTIGAANGGTLSSGSTIEASYFEFGNLVLFMYYGLFDLATNGRSVTYTLPTADLNLDEQSLANGYYMITATGINSAVSMFGHLIGNSLFMQRFNAGNLGTNPQTISFFGMYRRG